MAKNRNADNVTQKTRQGSKFETLMDWESIEEYLNEDIGMVGENPKVVMVHDNPLSQRVREKESDMRV